VAAVWGVMVVADGQGEHGNHDSHREGSGEGSSGRYLISDQYNNRVIVVKRDHRIVWQFGDGSTVAGPHSVVGPNDAQTVGDEYLISGTGVPGGSPEDALGCTNGCLDNRVFLVNSRGQITWQYGTAGCANCELNAPVQATWVPPSSVLITDQGNARVILVNRQKQITWQYGGTTGLGFNQLNNPNSGEKLANGHILIADEGNNRVIEVNPTNKAVVWSFPAANPPDDTLNAPAFASRLSNGHTLISDSGNNRIIEVDSAGQIKWQYPPAGSSDTLNVPTRGIRLKNGHTLISDQNNNRVLEVTASGAIVFQQGSLTAGNGFNQLNGPYDAKLIGDFTGLTPP